MLCAIWYYFRHLINVKSTKAAGLILQLCQMEYSTVVVFHVFLNQSNGTKWRKVSHMIKEEMRTKVKEREAKSALINIRYLWLIKVIVYTSQKSKSPVLLFLLVKSQCQLKQKLNKLQKGLDLWLRSGSINSVVIIVFSIWRVKISQKKYF